MFCLLSQLLCVIRRDDKGKTQKAKRKENRKTTIGNTVRMIAFKVYYLYLIAFFISFTVSRIEIVL